MLKFIWLVNVQVNVIVSPSVTPIISEGNQCYLVSTRFILLFYFQMMFLLLCYTPKVFFLAFTFPFFFLNNLIGVFFFVLCSVSQIFPPASFNFAGGASMVLKPEDYLIPFGPSVICCSSLLLTYSFSHQYWTEHV